MIENRERELIATFESEELKQIRDWIFDELSLNEPWKATVDRAIIGADGRVLDQIGRKRLILGISVLNNVGASMKDEFAEYQDHKLDKVWVFENGPGDDDFFLQCCFLPR